MPALSRIGSTAPMSEWINARRAAGGTCLEGTCRQPGEGHSVSLSDAVHGVVIADAISWVGPLTTNNMNIELGKMTTASQLQRTIDEGDQRWRLDPLETARADAVALGVSPNASFDRRWNGRCTRNASATGVWFRAAGTVLRRAHPTSLNAITRVRGRHPAALVITWQLCR